VEESGVYWVGWGVWVVGDLNGSISVVCSWMWVCFF
jgi:hypothetical protein